ncbi:hypothetical protein [Ferruginibacter sp. HRS2-29]|uniref:hypothetical protein n=1 Tax=Ferruginibacter sp. HRS2-29 TaxID=2487334 RepID=UPI0020CF9F8E|nr:hypothetical protein [Ferruginibacter sp. HRS2-29]MCP9749827.1 hypothetical protein [Ferruginibacter sp. HRS2-29]
MKDDLFDKLIQQKAGGHEAPVPADAWANISGKNKKRRYVAWWWFTGVVLLAGITLGGYYQLKNNDEPAAVASVKKNAGDEVKRVPESDPFTRKTIEDGGSTKDNSITGTQKNDRRTDTGTVQSTALSGVSKGHTTGVTTNKNPKGTEASVSKNSITSRDENDGIALNKRTKKRIAGRSKVTITNSNPVTPDEADEVPENGLLSTNKNNIPGTVQPSPVARGQVDSTGKDSASAISKKIDLLQMTPETGPENNSVVVAKKDLPGKKRSGLYADLSITPYIAFYKNDPLISVKRITTTPMRKTEFTATDIRSSTEAAFAYTLALRKHINKKLAVGTGIQYSFIKENVRLSGLETSTDFNVIKRLNPNNGAPFLFDDTVSSISTGQRIIHATNSYSLVSIPVLLHYELYNRDKWAFSFVGGTYLNISTRYHNSISGELQPLYKKMESGSRSEYKFTADLFAGFRFSRRISNKYVAFAEPGLRYSLMKYDMQRVVNNKYIHRAGLSFGVSWKLSQ